MKTLLSIDLCIVDSCQSIAFTRGWCGRHYWRWREYGDTEKFKNATRDMSLDERLHHYGWTVTDSGCWEWNGGRNENNYGILWVKNVGLRRAHRIAYELWVEPIPEGLFILHSCDNPPCINPAHLRAGTPLENTSDMDERGRRKNAPRYGEKNHFSKLTRNQVQEIRDKFTGRRGEKVALAREYETSPSNITYILSGQTWKEGVK